MSGSIITHFYDGFPFPVGSPLLMLSFFVPFLSFKDAFTEAAANSRVAFGPAASIIKVREVPLCQKSESMPLSVGTMSIRTRKTESFTSALY